MKRNPLLVASLGLALFLSGCAPAAGYILRLAFAIGWTALESATGRVLEAKLDQVLSQYVKLAPQTKQAVAPSAAHGQADKMPPLRIIDSTHAQGQGLFNFTYSHNGRAKPFSIMNPDFVKRNGRWVLDPKQKKEAIDILETVDNM